MEAPRLLIAGCGALGLELAAQARAQGFECFGMRRSPPAGPAPLTWIRGDVLAPDAGQLPQNLTALVYAVSAGGREPIRYRQAYLDGPTALLSLLAARDGSPPRCLFVSSTAVWGQADGALVDEASPPSPVDPFAELLLAGERRVAELDPDSASCRAGGLYGPGRRYAIERAQAGAPLAPGSRTRFTNRIHLEDAARALLFLLGQPKLEPLYCLVDLRPSSEQELFSFLASELGLPPPRESAAAEAQGATLPGRAGNKRVRPTRLLQLGFEWRYPSFVEGYRALLGPGNRGQKP